MRQQVGWCHRQLARREEIASFWGVISSGEHSLVVASLSRSFDGFLGVIFSGRLLGDEVRVELLEVRLEIAEGLGEAGKGRLRGRVHM